MRDANRSGNVMKLHAYGRSSASFRVRITFNLKGLNYETVSHDLTRDEQLAVVSQILSAEVTRACESDAAHAARA